MHQTYLDFHVVLGILDVLQRCINVQRHHQARGSRSCSRPLCLRVVWRIFTISTGLQDESRGISSKSVSTKLSCSEDELQSFGLEANVMYGGHLSALQAAVQKLQLVLDGADPVQTLLEEELRGFHRPRTTTRVHQVQTVARQLNDRTTVTGVWSEKSAGMVGHDLAALNTNTSTAMSEINQSRERTTQCTAKRDASFSCCGKDTGWIVHVGLRCVEVRVRAEQLGNQRQHQRWVTGTQELQTPGGKQSN
ncbi:hypothetical protein EYF80_041821 [Liparis tanakae]|uniref:Uncharacterized protein n=1 Tax=Liparis tanakae TaxID=230148 RepID=A0A4Z2G388_9TELE|nr:hypothetical protein EYF80_041821 [Liparis tanakae]